MKLAALAAVPLISLQFGPKSFDFVVSWWLENIVFQPPGLQVKLEARPGFLLISAAVHAMDSRAIY